MAIKLKREPKRETGLRPGDTIASMQINSVSEAGDDYLSVVKMQDLFSAKIEEDGTLSIKIDLELMSKLMQQKE